MVDNIIVFLLCAFIVFSTLVCGILALICSIILRCTMKLYTEFAKERFHGKREK